MMVSSDEELGVSVPSIGHPSFGHPMPAFDPRVGGYQRVIRSQLRKLEKVCGQRVVTYIGYAAPGLSSKFLSPGDDTIGQPPLPATD